jgi:hypothetical protein
MKAAETNSAPPIPRTSPVVLAVLILVLIGLVCATVKMTFYPSQPAALDRLHDPKGLSVADANELLSKSGAILDSVKAGVDTTTETWTYKHRTGSWGILVHFSKTAAGDVIDHVQMRCDVSNFPSFTRTWDYPKP